MQKAYSFSQLVVHRILLKAAVYYLAKMLYAGEDIKFIARRIMLRVVRTQLECCCCPVGDVLGILGSTPDLKELVFIPECIKLCDSEPFPQAWSDSLSARKNTVGLTSSDVSRLVSFGRSLGTTALEGQIANCDMFCADFELRLSEAREKKKKYAKVLPPLGALAGAVIVIAAV